MKLKAALICVLLSLVIPVAALAKSEKGKEEQAAFKIYDEACGEILSVSDRDFLIGAIVCEMPLSFEDEALKAQGIASYTFYSKLRNESRGEYDFAADTKSFYVYTDTENMKKRFGDNFDEYYKRLSSLADEIYGKALTYESELITSAYFAISSGNTEKCEDIWGGKLPCLEAAASPWDAFACGYCEKSEFTLGEVNEILKAQDLPLCEDINALFGKIERSASGSVISAEISGKETGGGKIRSMFSLRSQNFTVCTENGSLVFITKGYGHGVGMSQTGANYLAKAGYCFESILKWYYKGCEITQIK